jgi:hypothetical protein
MVEIALGRSVIFIKLLLRIFTYIGLVWLRIEPVARSIQHGMLSVFIKDE